MENKRMGGPWRDKDGNYHASTQEVPNEWTTSEIVHNMLRDILHFEQHHEKSEGITQYITSKYGKYI